MEYFENLEIINPNKTWVAKELESLIKEWEEWHVFTKTIEDHDYDPNTQTIMWKDGEENIEKQKLLIQKTVTFLSNNLENYSFMFRSGNGQLYEDPNSRLATNTKHRLFELKAINNSVSYARVPESYWKTKGKQIVDKLADKSPEVAAELLADYLKNPLAN